MITYRKRTSIDPIVWEGIDRADIQYMDYIETLDNGVMVRHEYWQEGKPAPAPVTHITKIEGWQFKGLFTPTEFRAVNIATETDDAVFQFWDMASTAPVIDVALPEVVAGMTYVATVIGMTDERRDELLLGKPVE